MDLLRDSVGRLYPVSYTHLAYGTRPGLTLYRLIQILLPVNCLSPRAVRVPGFLILDPLPRAEAAVVGMPSLLYLGNVIGPL